MTLDLSLVTFDNDICTIGLEDGGTLVLNKINESIRVAADTLDIKVINIEKIEYEENGEETHIKCTSVIGMSDGIISLVSAYKEYLGKILNEDNIQYCVLEV